MTLVIPRMDLAAVSYALLLLGLLFSSSCETSQPSDNIAKSDPEVHRAGDDASPTRLHGGRQGRGPWMED